MSARRRNEIDYTLLLLAMTLVVVGLVMVYSASAIWADQNLGNSLYFIKRQAFWTCLGVVSMATLSRLDYNRFKEWMWLVLGATVLGLGAALISPPIAGVRRWIRFGPIGLQPAEFAKLTSVLFLAHYLDRKRSRVISAPLRGLIAPTGIVMILLVLIGLEPDLGTPALMFCVSLLLLFIGGGKIQYILGALVAAIPALIYEVMKYPYRRARLLIFLSPWKDAQGKGYQIAQSLLAVGSGGWFGKGLGGGKLKLMYLPTPHTDFIFPVVCEELGLLGALTCVSLFAMLLVRGVRIARSAPNLFGTLLAAGITFTICLQAFFNMAMSIGMLPTKGIPLPFISFGGSSLLATLSGIGILLNISRQAKTEIQPAA